MLYIYLISTKAVSDGKSYQSWCCIPHACTFHLRYPDNSTHHHMWYSYQYNSHRSTGTFLHRCCYKRLKRKKFLHARLCSTTNLKEELYTNSWYNFWLLAVGSLWARSDRHLFSEQASSAIVSSIHFVWWWRSTDSLVESQLGIYCHLSSKLTIVWIETSAEKTRRLNQKAEEIRQFIGVRVQISTCRKEGVLECVNFYTNFFCYDIFSRKAEGFRIASHVQVRLCFLPEPFGVELVFPPPG